jgi:hypothetical protein
MKNSLEFLKELPSQEEFLQLAKKVGNKNVSTGSHLLQLISDEIGTRINIRTNIKEKVIWYHFKDITTGNLYKYAVPIKNKNGDVHYLIQKLGVLPEGSTVELTYVNKPNDVGGFVQVKVVEKSIELTSTNSSQTTSNPPQTTSNPPQTISNKSNTEEFPDNFGTGDYRSYKDYGDFENEIPEFEEDADARAEYEKEREALEEQERQERQAREEIPF